MAKKVNLSFELSGVTILLLVIALGVGYLLGNVFSVGSFSSLGKSYGTQTQTQPPTQQQQQAAKVKFDIPSYVPYKGSSSATVNVIEFGDYQCPFCERFFTQTEPQIIQNYVSTGKVKFYFMDFAFLGPDSQTLGQGAWCANDQGKYYDYHDYIYSHQGQENSGWASADKVKLIAANITGLDVQKFSSCLDSGTYKSRVTGLTQLGQSNGVSGTPSVFVGKPGDGYTLVVGAQPYSSFQTAIDSSF